MRHLSAIRVLRTLALILGVAFTVSACVIEADGFGPLSGTATGEWTRSYPVAAGTAIEVRAERTGRG